MAVAWIYMQAYLFTQKYEGIFTFKKYALPC